MNYQQTIDYLYSHLPMFTRIGAAAYKKDLHNTIALLEALGNPHKDIKTIHVAGTNGKGSTCHMLAAIFHENQYKTGLYTSPHLKDFRERIKVSGTGDTGKLEMIPEAFVVDFVEKTRDLINRVEPSFFELTVAMAFEYFAFTKVDIAIIETGLGGRLDSTNIITPELSIITNIGWDHMNLLGNTLQEIAFEKAGIIKPGVPVVVGQTLLDTKPVFEQQAAAKNAPAVYAEDYSISDVVNDATCLRANISGKGESFSYETDLPGSYQRYNLRTVVAAIQVLKANGWRLADHAVQHALQHVKTITGLHARWELVYEQPKVIVDVAHNEDGILQVLAQTQAVQPVDDKVHIILGMVRDKEVDKVLALFPKGYRYSFTNAQIPRALPAAELQQKANAYSLHGPAFDNVNEALQQAISRAGPDNLIVVCGSVFVAGEVDVMKLAPTSTDTMQ